MSDQNYDISVSINSGLKALKQFKQAATAFDKGRMAALVAQKNMLEQMKKLQEDMYKKPAMVPPSSPRKPPNPTQPTPDTSFVGPRIDKNTQNYLKKQAQERLKVERKLSRERHNQQSSLDKARQTVMNSAMMTELEASAAQKAAQASVKRRIALAKSAKEVREIVAQERASLRLAKKKSFLVSRMEASSKEFAGNMVSAFAIAGAGVFITQTGQQFEAAGNTMLSVSANAEEAGENLQFVKEEAFRLGLGLTQATKGFAKLAAARGEISLEDTKELFLGVSEASTLLGLTAEESNRALLAIQQINGLAS